MLHIILLILKILGIILLIILGILLLILYCVLFVAVSYRIRMEKQEDFRVAASAGWLFGIVTIRYMLDNADGWKKELQVRLFGIPILKPFEEKKPKKKKKPKRKEKSQENRRKKDKPAGLEVDQTEQRELEEGNDILPSEKTLKWEEKKSTLSIIDKILSIFRKLPYAIRGICDKIKNIWKKFLGIGDTIRSLLKRRDIFLEFWRLEEHVRARSAIWKEARYLWKKLRPKKIEGKVTFGFDDPATTGLCMGGVGMLCAWYPKKLQIIPDFEQEILKGDIRIRGKIRAYVLAGILWRVYFNKDIRYMYKHWKQL